MKRTHVLLSKSSNFCEIYSDGTKLIFSTTGRHGDKLPLKLLLKVNGFGKENARFGRFKVPCFGAENVPGFWAEKVSGFRQRNWLVSGRESTCLYQFLVGRARSFGTESPITCVRKSMVWGIRLKDIPKVQIIMLKSSCLQSLVSWF